MNENNTKKLIRKTAIKLFKEKGYDTVTLQDICLASNVSKHTFYYYFRSKEDLLKTITKTPIDATPEIMSRIMLIESPYEQYSEIFKVAVDHFEESGKDLMRKILVAKLTSSLENDIPKENKHIVDMMVGLIKKAQDKKEITNTSDPKSLLQASFCLMIGVAQVWATHKESEFDLSNTYFNLLAILLGKK